MNLYWILAYCEVTQAGPHTAEDPANYRELRCVKVSRHHQTSPSIHRAVVGTDTVSDHGQAQAPTSSIVRECLPGLG